MKERIKRKGAQRVSQSNAEEKPFAYFCEILCALCVKLDLRET